MARACQQCGSDLSQRHYLSKFCFPCANQRNRKYIAEYTKNNPKARAHEAVRRITQTAVRCGFLPDPKTGECVDCGRPAQCYDHRDYNKPLEVDAVCIRCNSLRVCIIMGPMNLPKMIQRLLDCGYNQGSLAKKLTERGTPCTQPTIFRILNKKSNPSYKLGEAIRLLYNETVDENEVAA